ncbi:MAG: 4'-phosphopantetheinyl transferase superfamily protein [Deltaproteobacteria bacterium]|nr:4'-phosphopantetheinyl transferase superfamily protein [Deltaproteobacteria bacterium]
MDGTILSGQCRIPAWANAEHLACGMSWLPVALHPEINRYHRLEDRLARLTARLLIRKTLQVLGLSRESTLDDWHKSPHGRPFLLNSYADISISHANPWVVSAVGLKCRIGIDVEIFRPFELDALIPYLTATEVGRIQKSSRPEVEALHCWSKREAILKADGRGLLAPEATIRDIAAARTPAGEAWRVKRMEFDDGCLYLACDGATDSLRRNEWSFTELLLS